MRKRFIRGEPLQLGEGGSVPDTVVLYRAGVVGTYLGPIQWGAAGAEQVAAAWRARSRDFGFDYEHMSRRPDATPAQMAASGWGTIAPTPEACVVSGVWFTDQAAGMIERGEMRYLSPVIALDDDYDPPMIVDVLMAALTNTPGTWGAAPIAFAEGEAAGAGIVPRPDQGHPDQGRPDRGPEPAPHPHGSPPALEVSRVLLERRDGSTLWGRRADDNLYTTPGGRARRGELPVDCAARELREEAGLRVPSRDLRYQGTLRASDSRSGAPVDVHVYRALVEDNVSPSPAGDPDHEVRAWEWLPAFPEPTKIHAPGRCAVSVLCGRASPAQMSEPTPNGDRNMNLTSFRAHLVALIGMLPALTGDQAPAELAQAAKDIEPKLRALDDALGAAGVVAAADGEQVPISNPAADPSAMTDPEQQATAELCEAVKTALGLKSAVGARGAFLAFHDASTTAAATAGRAAEDAQRAQRAARRAELLAEAGRLSPKRQGEFAQFSDADLEGFCNVARGQRLPNTRPASPGAPASAPAQRNAQLSETDRSVIAAAKSRGIHISEEDYLATKASRQARERGK